MERNPESQNAPGGPVTAEVQPPQASTQASGSQAVQPTPAVAQPTPQVASGSGVGLGPRPPPKSESDRAFRASRPISRPMSPATEEHFEDASDHPSGFNTNPIYSREQPVRQSSVRILEPQPALQSRAPSVARGQPGGPGYNEQGAYRLAEGPPALAPLAPPHPTRWNSTRDWFVPPTPRVSTYVVSPNVNIFWLHSVC